MAGANEADLQAIIAELRDTNKDKRRTAVMKLGMATGEEATRLLIRALDNQNEDLIVRARAALLLGKKGDVRAVAPLIRALDAPGHKTPIYAAESLGQLGDPRAIEPLVEIAKNSRDRLQEAALQSLQQLGYSMEEEDDDCEEPQPL
jgi:HEAT repeat protein